MLGQRFFFSKLLLKPLSFQLWPYFFNLNAVCLFPAKLESFWMSVRLSLRFLPHAIAHAQSFFIPASRPLIYGFWRNAHDQYTNLLARLLLIALQVVRTSFGFHWRECMGSNFPSPPPPWKWHFLWFLRGNFHHGHFVVLSEYTQNWKQCCWNVPGIPRRTLRTFHRSKPVKTSYQLICIQYHSKLGNTGFTVLFSLAVVMVGGKIVFEGWNSRNFLQGRLEF